MRTKRYAALLLALVMALSLTACKKDDEDNGGHANMAISPAELSEEEEALMTLLGISVDSYRIFDFQMGEDTQGVQSIRLRAYELAGSDWNCVLDASSPFTDAVGRLALTFGKMPEGVRMAYQSENNSVSRDFSMPVPEGEDTANLIYVTSVLTGSPAMELDEEVPLVLQIATSKSEFSSYQVDYFGMPRELSKHGYEHVYAITVTFSKDAPRGVQSAPAPAPESEEPIPEG